MKRYQVGYFLFVLFSLFLLYESGRGFFLGLVLVECLFPVILFLMLRREAHQFALTWEIQKSGMAGQSFALRFPMRCERCWAAGSILVAFRIENRLLCASEDKNIVIPVGKKDADFQIELFLESCGSRTLHCEKIQLQDMFGLFRRTLPCPSDLSVSVYPEVVPMELLQKIGTIQRQIEGSTAQNKKGTDRTDIYDLREYAAGDDIRSIHWKLSSKMGKQIVRESGSSTQLQTLVLLDAGLYEKDVPVQPRILCTGFAVASSLSSALIRQRYAHAVGMHTKNDLEVVSVWEQSSYLQALDRGQASPLPNTCGKGLLLFLMRNSENSFTRLFYITTAAELPIPDLRSMDGAEVTVLQVEDRKGEIRYTREEAVEVISIPAIEGIENAIKITI